VENRAVLGTCIGPGDQGECPVWEGKYAVRHVISMWGIYAEDLCAG